MAEGRGGYGNAHLRGDVVGAPARGVQQRRPLRPRGRGTAAAAVRGVHGAHGERGQAEVGDLEVALLVQQEVLQRGYGADEQEQTKWLRKNDEVGTSGFNSRWHTPLRWQWPSPSHSCRM